MPPPLAEITLVDASSVSSTVAVSPASDLDGFLRRSRRRSVVRREAQSKSPSSARAAAAPPAQESARAPPAAAPVLSEDAAHPPNSMSIAEIAALLQREAAETEVNGQTNLIATLRATVATLRSEAAQNAASHAAELAAVEAAAVTSSAGALEAVGAAHAEEHAEEHADHLARVAASHSELLEHVELEHATMATEKAREHERAMVAADAAHATAVATHAAALRNAQIVHRNTLQEATQAHTAALSAAHATHEAEGEADDAHHERELLRSDQRLRSTEVALKRQLADQAMGHRRLLFDTDAKHEKVLATLESSLQQSSLETAREASRRARKETADELHAHYQSDAHVHAGRAAVALQEERHELEIAELHDRIEELEHCLDQARLRADRLLDGHLALSEQQSAGRGRTRERGRGRGGVGRGRNTAQAAAAAHVSAPSPAPFSRSPSTLRPLMPSLGLTRTTPLQKKKNVWWTHVEGLKIGARVLHESRGSGTVVKLDPLKETVHVGFDSGSMHRYHESSWYKLAIVLGARSVPTTSPSPSPKLAWWTDVDGLNIGARVRHESRGSGTVVTMDPLKATVHVSFDGGSMHRYDKSSWCRLVIVLGTRGALGRNLGTELVFSPSPSSSPPSSRSSSPTPSRLSSSSSPSSSRRSLSRLGSVRLTPTHFA